MKNWFPRHWKCGPASEMVNNLGEMQSVCLPPSHLTETATLIFIVCGMTPCGTAGCAQQLGALALKFLPLLETVESCALILLFPPALPNLLKTVISILAQRPVQGF